MAPGFGEDDQRVCAANDIETLVPVNGEGRYTDEIFDLSEPAPLSLKGLNVIKETNAKEADEPYTDVQLEKYGLANLRIIQWLKLTGRLIKQEDYKHNYPHCWRTDQPIIYRGVSSWFVDVPKFRDRMVEQNQNINWIPDHIKEGRFGKWLENAREWSISRSRFWGSPIPVWRSDNPDNKELYVFGSIAELNEFFDADVTDLHRPYIDELTKPDPHNPEYTIRRVEDVFDCWFESGSMPYAQVHYPFENKEWFETHFPAQFIVEYEAQTRGWFYSMMVLGVALFDKNPFENCICHGVVLDESGRKLSKKLQNYMDPRVLFEKFGSDALRWFMMSSTIMRGNELLLDAEGKFIHDAIRLYIKPIWNACHFFTLYANADGVKAKLISESDNVMDRYILAKLRDATEKAEAALDAYDTPTATQIITQFFEILNNWYIRRNRSRFWGQEKNADKQAAYDTLYTSLNVMCRVCAPLLPLISEAAFRALSGEESVHLADWPDVSAIVQEEELVADMDRVRDACTAIHAIRNQTNIRTRQPLSAATLYGSGSGRLADFASLIADETNIKQIHFSDELDAVANHKLTIHFPVAGKRLGAKMKAVGSAARNGEWELQGNQMIVGGETLQPEEYTMQLEAKEAAAAQALPSNDALVVLDTTLTPELEAEGTARDLVRMIQQARKDAGLDVSDRITLCVSATPEIEAAAGQFRDYICEQTQTDTLTFGSNEGEHSIAAMLNDTKVELSFSALKEAAA
jgi:isoleucyl-tRNA synthetase